MREVIKVFKGTDKDMKCRGMQYKINETQEDTGAIRCGDRGFHSCEAPFDVLKYYPLRNGNRYFEAEAGGVVDRNAVGDSKLASSELTLKAEIGLPELIKAQVAYTRKKAESGTAGGDRSNLAGGDRSNLAGGDSSSLAGGDFSVMVGRNGCRAKGGKNSVIVLTEWKRNDAFTEFYPVCVKAEIVDGERIKAGTWYTLKDGEFVETK